MQSEKQKILNSIAFPAFFTIIMWVVKFSELSLGRSYANFGIFPLKIKGLIGIITSPLIHGDMNHLIANTIPLFVLMIGLFYFYNKIAYKVFFLTYVMTGLWVWVAARSSYHIGASGIVYGLAAFIILSGIIRNNMRLMAFTLLIIFLYGGLIWGIFPNKPNVSWESHLLGMVAGLALAIYYRKEGPKPDKSIYDDEDDEDTTNHPDFTGPTQSDNSVFINYEYKEEERK